MLALEERAGIALYEVEARTTREGTEAQASIGDYPQVASLLILTVGTLRLYL